MRSVCRLWAVLCLLVVGAECARAQLAEQEWQTAAKDMVNYTAGLLEQKVKSDKAALAGLKKVQKELLKEKELTRVAKDLKKKLGTDKPAPEKIKELQASIKQKVEKADPDEIKQILRQVEKAGPDKSEAAIEKMLKAAGLPWPFGRG